jgi:hypothetical protein
MNYDQVVNKFKNQKEDWEVFLYLLWSKGEIESEQFFKWDSPI